MESTPVRRLNKGHFKVTSAAGGIVFARARVLAVEPPSSWLCREKRAPEDGKKRFRKSVSSTFFERLRSSSAKTLLKLNNNPAGFAGYFRVEKCGQTKAGEHKQVAHQA